MAITAFKQDLVKCKHSYNLGYGDGITTPDNADPVLIDRYQIPWIKFDGYWYRLKGSVRLATLHSTIEHEIYSSEQFETLVLENLE